MVQKKGRRERGGGVIPLREGEKGLTHSDMPQLAAKNKGKESLRGEGFRLPSGHVR